MWQPRRGSPSIAVWLAQEGYRLAAPQVLWVRHISSRHMPHCQPPQCPSQSTRLLEHSKELQQSSPS